MLKQLEEELVIEFYKDKDRGLAPYNAFVSIPKQFYKCPFYRKYLTPTARELYAFLLENIHLVDEEGYRVSIFKRTEAMKTLNIKDKACSNSFKILRNLGLIYEEKAGFGKSNLIYIAKAKDMSEEEALEKIELVESRKGK